MTLNSGMTNINYFLYVERFPFSLWIKSLDELHAVRHDLRFVVAHWNKYQGSRRHMRNTSDEVIFFFFLSQSALMFVITAKTIAGGWTDHCNLKQ